ncbi:MAG: protein-glutamate O-methyltransferase CheR [Chromatiales bacterium]|nr:protein-glutamate O-methyltransferase CheR [Chromatiales bacterium]
MPVRKTLSHEEYVTFQKFLEDACGIVLGVGKEYLVSSRLSGLMRESGIANVGDLLTQLRTDRTSKLKTAIIDAMTTNETFWFRDMAHFRMLTEKAFPEILGRQSGRPLRIWSAACSSGQEPYNLSMIAHDYQMRNPGRVSNVEIVATDISTTILQDAKKGIYCGIAASRGLTQDQRSRYFLAKGDCLEVRPEVKRRVTFRELNLTKGYELLGKFDVVFCRNVLIYFSSEQKQDILRRIARSLNPGGYLFMGSTESLSAHSDQYEMVSALGGIAYRLK